MELTADNVRETLNKCFFKEADEDPRTNEEKIAAAIKVAGVRGNVFGFDPIRVEEQKANIASMLSQLPDQFHAGKGDGWSFLNACLRQDGEQWGEHIDIDELFAMGQAAGFVTIPLPREVWQVLYGGMPYFKVNVPEEYTKPLVNENGKEVADGEAVQG